MKGGTRVVALIGVLASFGLVVRQQHQPGDFQPVIVGTGIALAAFAAIIGIMRSNGPGRIDVRGARISGWMTRWANNDRALIATLVAGMVIAAFGMWDPAAW